MLQRLGDSLKSQKWLAYLVLGTLALVFAAWGAYGIVNLSLGASSYAAEADGQKISLEKARSMWLRQQSQLQQRFGGELPAPLRTGLQDRVLEGLIVDALLDQRTHSLGYRVTDDELRDAIHQIPAFQINGKYDPAAARAVLAQEGMSIEGFADEMRSQMRRAALENGIRSSDFLTPFELARLHALEAEEREVRVLSLPVEKFPGAPVDEAAIQAYYKAHQAQYMTPESAHIVYAQLRLDVLAAEQQISEADLKAAYEKQRSRLEVPERRHARHILISIGKDDAAALKKAQQVLADAKAGKDFAELARKSSDDPGSAQKGGDLDWADRNTFVGPFTDALFSMSPGEIRGPVKTQFGYHIIQLQEVQAGKTKSFEDARGELETQLRKDRASDRFGEIQEQLHSRLDQPGANWDALVREFHLQSGEIAQFLRGAGAPPLGGAQPAQDLVFGESALPIGRAGGPVLIGDDRLAMVRVLDRHKPEPKPLAEVREGIVTALRKERGTEAALKAAEAARARLAAGASLDEIAKELGATAEAARFIGRKDPSIPAPLRDAAFAAPKPAGKPVFRAVSLESGAAAVIGVLQVRSAPQPPEGTAITAEARQEAVRHGTAAIEAYLEQVRKEATVRKNPKAFE